MDIFRIKTWKSDTFVTTLTNMQKRHVCNNFDQYDQALMVKTKRIPKFLPNTHTDALLTGPLLDESTSTYVDESPNAAPPTKRRILKYSLTQSCIKDITTNSDGYVTLSFIATHNRVPKSNFLNYASEASMLLPIYAHQLIDELQVALKTSNYCESQDYVLDFF